jgi:hypothetical protein
MEAYKVWAVLFRMSTESSLLLATPFDHKEIDPQNQDDHLKLGEWCLSEMGGSWIPAFYIKGIEKEALEVQKDFLEKMGENE